MSKKDTSNSYFKNTFGKQEGEKPGNDSGDSREKKSFGDKKKDFSKDRKSGAEGRFEQKKYDGPRKPFERKDGDAPRRRFDDNEGKPFEKRDRADGARKPFEKRDGEAPRRRFDDNESKPFERKGVDNPRKNFEPRDSDAPRRSFPKTRDGDAPRKPFEKRDGDAPRRRFDDNEGKPFEKRDRNDAPRKPFEKRDGEAPRRRFDDNEGKPFERRERSDAPRKSFDKNEKPFGKKDRDADAPKRANPSARGTDNQTTITRDNQVHNTKIGAHLKPSKSRLSDEDDFEDDFVAPEKEAEKMPLNKYIAHCGICSRRDAVEFIKQGKVKVNGELATEPGMKIAEGDAVSVAGKKIVTQKNLTYILLNKPKGFITTTEDEKGRRTIMDLVASADAPRLYPIGRLDRNTTGLIILTNDGELSQKLSHPKYNIKKIYQVTLDKPITKVDFEKILAGVTLEDGLAPVDSLAMLEEKNEVGIEIHSGKNRIVRRIFEHLGYVVEKLDRVMYAGLTKKNVPRGKWRLLTEREVILLKHFKS